LEEISSLDIKYGTENGTDLFAEILPTITCDGWKKNGQPFNGDHHMMTRGIATIITKSRFGPCGLFINGKVYERTLKVTKEIEDYCKEHNISCERKGFESLPPKYRK
jgi:hypothetical protein